MLVADGPGLVTTMTKRQWTGAAVVALALVGALLLQVTTGSVFTVETRTWEAKEPEQLPGGATFQVLGGSTLELHFNWPVALPVALIAAVGMVALVWPSRRSRTEKPIGHSN
jgi:hypothetical protein